MSQSAEEFISGLAKDFGPLTRKILSHPFIREAEAGKLSKQKLQRFVKEQYHIILGDFRNLALYLATAPELWIQDFFLVMVNAERSAYEHLLQLGKALGVTEDMRNSDPLPGALAFTSFFTRLASHGSHGQVASAIVLDLEVWGENCRKLSDALKKNYGLTSEDTGFLDAFHPVSLEFKARAMKIVEHYLPRPKEEKNMRIACRLALEYELMFWDAVYQS